MNLPRLRELHAVWCNGSIRTNELTELRDMLPEVIEALAYTSNVNDAARSAVEYADRLSGLAPAEDDADAAVYDYERGEWLGGEHSITRYGMFVQGFMHALLRAR